MAKVPVPDVVQVEVVPVPPLVPVMETVDVEQIVWSTPAPAVAGA